jgi:hypothetical protein
MTTFRLINFAQHFADELGRDVLGLEPSVLDRFAAEAKAHPDRLEELGRRMALACPPLADGDDW